MTELREDQPIPKNHNDDDGLDIFYVRYKFDGLFHALHPTVNDDLESSSDEDDSHNEGAHTAIKKKKNAANFKTPNGKTPNGLRNGHRTNGVAKAQHKRNGVTTGHGKTPKRIQTNGECILCFIHLNGRKLKCILNNKEQFDILHHSSMLIFYTHRGSPF